MVAVLPSPLLTSNHHFLLPSLTFFRNQSGIFSRQRKYKLDGKIMASSSCSSNPTSENGIFCRRNLMLTGFSTSLSLILPFSTGSDAEEEVKMAHLIDDINAYSYSYPLGLPSKKLAFKWVESRKPERYSSAAPLSPDARLRIVSERVDFIDNLVISVSIGPPNAQILKSNETSAWSAKVPGMKSYPFGKIEPNSTKYFGACMLGGIVACGPTHTFVTPLDLVKTRRQVDSNLYKSNVQGWKTIYAKEGLRGVFTGWSPTFIGYSFQGLGKYGFYEVFKHVYGDNLFPNTNKTVIFLGASASAEFIADIFLCPFESLKVRMQTTIPPYASNLREAWAKTTAEGGISKLYAGIVPLWGRQIPYTMCKFATFEETVSLIYSKMLGGKKDDYGKLAQTGVSFLGGYIAGIACAVVSHPADVMVSKLNSDRKAGESAGKAMSRIYGNIGFAGLWNGLPVRIVMIGTLTAFQWLIYDSFKVYLGLPTTGGH